MGGRDAEKDKQFQWLKQRNSYGANTPCLKRAYAQQQLQLDQLLQDRVVESWAILMACAYKKFSPKH